MQWLTALLAFAVTMLIFAIIVSTFVEVIHRIRRHRSAGMRLMLENLYSKVIEPRLAKTARPTPKPTKEQFAAFIMENRAMGEPGGGLIARTLRNLVDASVMSDIPVEVFTQKLADNRIVTEADNLTSEIIDDFAQKYEAFGREASEFFERRARVFSVFVAFFVAWAFYVHPYKIAVAYVKTPELAQMVADSAPEVYAQHSALQAKLDQAKADNQINAAEAAMLEKAIKDIGGAFEDGKKQTKELAAMGVPVGWPAGDAQVENCRGGSAKPEDMKDQDWKPLPGFCRMTFPIIGRSALPSDFGGAFWLLVGGLLVGLGAPFWAQAVSSLTASRDLAGKITEIVNPSQRAPGTRGFAPSGSSHSTAFAAFDRAAKAQGLNQGVTK